MTIEQAHATFGSLESNIGILSYFDKFSDRPDPAVPAFTYIFDDKNLNELYEKYDVGHIIGDGNSISQISAVMNWVHGILKPGGTPGIQSNSLAILDAAESDTNQGFSCDQYAIAMAEVCLSAGIPARLTFLQPFNPNQAGNHVVVSVWTSDKSKWIVCDPQYDVYYEDNCGTPLDAFELREALIQHQPIHPCASYDYYGYWSEDIYRIFLAKSIFSLTSPVSQGFQANDPSATWVYIRPEGFDPIYRQIKFDVWYAAQNRDVDVDYRVSDKQYKDYKEKGQNWIFTSSKFTFKAPV